MNNETEQIFILNTGQGQPSTLSEKLIEVEIPGTTHTSLENVEDFSNVCRTCATITEFVIPIFAGEGLQNNLAEKIHKHLPIKVCEADVLPRVVCYQCASTLLAWHELVQCCVQADAALRVRALQPIQESKFTNLEPNSTLKEETQSKRLLPEVPEVEQSVSRVLTRVTGDLEKPELSVGEDGKRYAMCGVCHKSVRAGGWRRHARAHRGEKRYSCTACGLAFADSGNLARHVRALHAQLRPHTCNTCRKTFTRRAHLREHERSHSSRREFVCDVCGAASKSGAALRMHRARHAAPALACAHCPAAFRRAPELRAHRAVHSGERAHACRCGRTFRLRAQLAAHCKRRPSCCDLPGLSGAQIPVQQASERPTDIETI